MGAEVGAGVAPARYVPGVLLLLACATERGPRPAVDEVTYGGWVYDGPLYEGVIPEGTLTFAISEEEPVVAEQPYDDYPGYFLATLPRSQPFELRVDGVPDAYPTVWAGETPGSNGSWLQGAVFAGQMTYVDEMIAGLTPDAAPRALTDGAAHVWGMPADGADWDCAALTIQGAAPRCFALDDAGVLSEVAEGPFYWFFAFDVEPGVVDLAVDGATLETWTATPGDIVMAFWLEQG